MSDPYTQACYYHYMHYGLPMHVSMRLSASDAAILYAIYWHEVECDSDFSSKESVKKDDKKVDPALYELALKKNRIASLINNKKIKVLEKPMTSEELNDMLDGMEVVESSDF